MAKLDFIQHFRAIAAIAVAIAHGAKELINVVPDLGAGSLEFLYYLEYGQIGVDLFFVISGFIMFYVLRTAAGGSSDALKFIFRRFIRIAPIYWLFTSLFLFVALANPTSINNNGVDAVHVLGSYLFVPTLNPSTGNVNPAYGLGWTLNYEMFFYAIMSALVLFRLHHSITVIMAFMLVLAVIGNFISSDASIQIWYWTRSIVFEFGLGAAIAYFYLKKSVEIGIYTSIAIIFVSIGVSFYFYISSEVPTPEANIRAWGWGIPSAAIICAVALCPRFRNVMTSRDRLVLMGHIGDASYSLYLAHMFFIRAITMLIAPFLLGFWPVLLFVQIVVSVAGALVVYRVVEKPLHAFGNSLFERNFDKRLQSKEN